MRREETEVDYEESIGEASPRSDEPSYDLMKE
jgi:hypothetical protein